MAPSRALTTAYPPELTIAESEQLLATIKDWSIAHGLAVRPPPSLVSAEADPHGVLATTAPVTLFPSPFPQVCFGQAKSIQKAYNQLYAAIAQDEEFLQEIVQEILEVDEFIAELWQVHLKVKAEGYVQNLSLGLFRSDYMVHQTNDDDIPVVKQVEFNTIASSFGGLSSQTSKLHKYLSTTEYPDLTNAIPSSSIDLPPNTSTTSLANGIATAFSTYIKQETPLHTPCVIFLVQSPERNIFDQRHLEYALHEIDPSIPTFRLAFSDILDRTSIADTPKRQLLYHHPANSSKTFEAAVIYFRSGYGPSDYPTAESWTARYHLERSNAIKCPTILTQLAGAKKIQQVLATPTSPSTPSILTRFLPNMPADEIAKLSATFTNIFPLDSSPAGKEALSLALDQEKCKSYVLKPQREGGGNNTYRTSIPPFLQSLPPSHYKSFILMELITPPPLQNYILRNGVIEQGGVICELGVYGTCLWESGKGGSVLWNEEAGYLLRTKGDKSEEGGVAAGFGSMDSVRLV
ncbi:glutathione synthetase-like protein [Halenospora varia]|nr:glutathione synthetase-like protein [Halenospora varia]